MESITPFLERKLKVQVNRDKSKVVRAEASTFLGFNERRPVECISQKAGTYLYQNTVDQDSPR